MRVRFRKTMEFAVENSLLMVLGTVIALIWANADPAGYEAAVHPLHFVVNDIGMVFFFGLAMKEIIEATAAGGPLDSFRRASVPVIAAVGGMAGPAAVYVALASAAGAPELLRGWAIPCATDIAFSYLIARFVFGSTLEPRDRRARQTRSSLDIRTAEKLQRQIIQLRRWPFRDRLGAMPSAFPCQHVSVPRLTDGMLAVRVVIWTGPSKL